MSIPKGTLFDTHKVRFNVVKSALKEIECKQTDSDNTARIIWWDGYMRRDELLNMYPHQRINRIPGMDQICFKSNTFNAMNKLRKINSDLFNFFPLTYVLPDDFDLFRKEAEAMLKKNEELKIDHPTWIFKPRNGQCGIGIQLFQDPSIINDRQKYNGVIQSYISPHLYNGIKFDLRLYLFVSTIKPYTVYLYREGLSRFCTEPYVKPNAENLNDLYMHLTNTSVNIKNQKADKNGYLQFATPVLTKLNKPDLWNKIKKVAALSMVAQYHQIIDQIEQEEIILAESNMHFKTALNPNQNNDNVESGEENKDIIDLPPIDKLHRYFHLAGIDILINDKYEPILLEMNDRPSMFVSFEDIERELKKNLVKEALSLISLDGSPVAKDFGKWERILPVPDDEEFNKKTLELMNKSLNKPITSFTAVKIPPPQKKPEIKPRKPIQSNQFSSSQIIKKHHPTDQSVFTQSTKTPNPIDKTTIRQIPSTDHGSSTQIAKSASQSEKSSSPQISQKAQTEKIVKDQKPKKAPQQEPAHQQSLHATTKPNIIPKTRERSPDRSRGEEVVRTHVKKRKPSASSSEKSTIRASYSSKSTTAKDLRISTNVAVESQTLRRTQDHVNVSPDSSPIPKITKSPTYQRSVKPAINKKANPTKNDHISSASSGNTLPPLDQNKESLRGDKNRAQAPLSSLPGINQMNCQ